LPVTGFGVVVAHIWVENVSHDEEEVETEVRKWLIQQSKEFYAAGFHALIKRWDKYIISVGGG
jgi:hypothetical protein